MNETTENCITLQSFENHVIKSGKILCMSNKCSFWNLFGAPGCFIASGVVITDGKCNWFTTTPFETIFPNHPCSRHSNDKEQSPHDTERY